MVSRNQRRRRQRQGQRGRVGPRGVRRTTPVVVVQTPRSRRRRGRRRTAGRTRILGGPGGGSNSFTFEFSKTNLKGNSKGTIKFGPSLAECPSFANGILAAFHEYKITSARVQFKSEASSTTSGSISYELDPHCKLNELKSDIKCFGITQTGAVSWGARQINGLEWLDATTEQFYYHYKGSGDGSAAGRFIITMNVVAQNPK
nr:coat protein [cacao leafroll virus]